MQRIARSLGSYTKYCKSCSALSVRTGVPVCAAAGLEIGDHVTMSKKNYSAQTLPLSYHASVIAMTAETDSTSLSSPKKSRRRKHAFIPQSAAVKLTEEARRFFKQLLENRPRPEIVGIMLNYSQSKEGDMRMVFSFQFVTANDLSPSDEPVSLEVLDDGATPKPFVESVNDGLPKLYVHGDAFLKVLGAKVDIDRDTLTPILYDREGNVMDPNA